MMSLRAFLLFLVTLTVSLPANAFGNRPDGAAEPIRLVVEAHVAALAEGDIEAAYALMSRDERRRHRSAERFARSVSQDYPALLNPAKVLYLSVKRVGGLVFQDVLVISGEGSVRAWVEVEQDGAGEWRIKGYHAQSNDEA